MFKSLTIHNFQRHKYLKIRFDPHVTTIVGPNDSGKSAIIRALRWLCLNRPIGRAFIRSGTRNASVLIRFDEGRIVARSIGKNNNVFRYNQKRFKAFARNVPAEITESLRISELNFQRHHDSVFWFSLTPGQLAKELNKLVDLDTIDKVQAIVAKRIKDTKTELEVHKLALKEATETVDSLKWVRELDVNLGKLEKLYPNPAKSHKMARLSDAIGLAMVYADRCQTLASVAAKAASVTAAGGSAVALSDRSRRLASIIRRIVRTNRIANWTLPAIENPVKMNQLRTLISQISQTEEQQCQLEKRLQQKKKKLEEKLGGRCPSCGGILTDRTWL